MNTGIRNALNAYQVVGTDAHIEGASPHQLVMMLFQGALDGLVRARSHMEQNEVAPKGEMISKVIGIIDEGLKQSLNEVEGGDLARNLKALYEYMVMRLLYANVRNDLAALDEVADLIKQLQAAWQDIGSKPMQPAEDAAGAMPELAVPEMGAEAAVSRLSQRA